MNERQRDLFLWQWSRRRVIGRSGAILRGLAIGAAGGLAFAVAMGLTMGGADDRSTAATMEAAKSWFLMLGLAVPSFAALMAGIAARVFVSHESMYQAILRTGARVPDARPTLRAADRGPQIAVFVAVAILVGLIVALFLAYG